MPTRPTLPVPLWASNPANYSRPGKTWDGQPRRDTTGFTAFVENGVEPEQPDAGQLFNEFQFRSTEWINWTIGGSPLPLLETSIVERDANGRSQLATAELGGTASPNAALIASRNTGGAADDPTAVFSNTADGSAISASAQGSLSAVSASTTGTGAAVGGFSSAGGFGVFGSGVNGADGGVLGQVNDTCQQAMRAEITGAPIAGQRALDVIAAAAATGVQIRSTDGPGLDVASSGAVSAALRVGTKAADPAVGVTGDIQPLTTNEIRVFADGGWRSLRYSQGPFTRGYDRQVGVAGPSGTVLASVTIPAIANPYALTRTGIVVLRFEGRAGSSAALAAGEARLQLRLRDETAAVDIVTETCPIAVQSVPNRAEHAFTLTAEYTIPATGAREFRAIMDLVGPGATLYTFDYATLTVEGVY